MSRLARAAATAAILATALPAAAYQRAETQEDPSIKLYWPSRHLSYAMNQDGPGLSSSCIAADALVAVETSFNSWANAASNGQVCTDLQLTSQGLVSSIDVGRDVPHNLVVWRHGTCLQPGTDPCHDNNTCGNVGDCWDYGANIGGDVVALTTTTYVVQTGEIAHADIELYGAATGASGGFNFTCSDTGVEYDIQNVVTHESGHFFGLADLYDAADSDATMYGNTAGGETTKQTLSPDDVNGICYIYPKGAPTPGAVSHDSGCASAPGAGGVSLLVALLALLRRRRAV